MPTKKTQSQSPPQVPVVYPGDTNETIRRAQWIEGAKKEGVLVWWGSASPAEANKIIAGFNKIYPVKRVSAAEAPRSREDLLDPKWKGHIALTADMKAWVTLALEEGGWGIERTEDFLRKLKQQQVLWAAGHTAGNTLLISGEFKIMGESYVYQSLSDRRRRNKSK